MAEAVQRSGAQGAEVPASRAFPLMTRTSFISRSLEHSGAEQSALPEAIVLPSESDLDVESSPGSSSQSSSQSILSKLSYSPSHTSEPPRWKDTLRGATPKSNSQPKASPRFPSMMLKHTASSPQGALTPSKARSGGASFRSPKQSPNGSKPQVQSPGRKTDPLKEKNWVPPMRTKSGPVRSSTPRRAKQAASPMRRSADTPLVAASELGGPALESESSFHSTEGYSMLEIQGLEVHSELEKDEKNEVRSSRESVEEQSTESHAREGSNQGARGGERDPDGRKSDAEAPKEVRVVGDAVSEEKCTGKVTNYGRFLRRSAKARVRGMSVEKQQMLRFLASYGGLPESCLRRASARGIALECWSEGDLVSDGEESVPPLVSSGSWPVEKKAFRSLREMPASSTEHDDRGAAAEEPHWKVLTVRRQADSGDVAKCSTGSVHLQAETSEPTLGAKGQLAGVKKRTAVRSSSAPRSRLAASVSGEAELDRRAIRRGLSTRCGEITQDLKHGVPAERKGSGGEGTAPAESTDCSAETEKRVDGAGRIDVSLGGWLDEKVASEVASVESSEGPGRPERGGRETGQKEGEETRQDSGVAERPLLGAEEKGLESPAAEVGREDSSGGASIRERLQGMELEDVLLYKKQMRDTFARLLLGNDPSGGNRGSSPACAISRGFTNLASSVFKNGHSLEPLSLESKQKWSRKLEWLISPAYQIVEMRPGWMETPNGKKTEVMQRLPRVDIQTSLPVLRKLDAVLLSAMDTFVDQEFSYHKLSDRSAKPLLPFGGLSPEGLRKLRGQREVAMNVYAVAMAIHAQTLEEMPIPEQYWESLPKTSKAALGEELYRALTEDSFALEGTISALGITEEQAAAQAASSLEAAILLWQRKIAKQEKESSEHARSFRSRVELMTGHGAEKRELWAQRALEVQQALVATFPGLLLSRLAECKIEANKDVGQAILEGYSRVLASKASDILTGISHVLELHEEAYSLGKALRASHEFHNGTQDSPTSPLFSRPVTPDSASEVSDKSSRFARENRNALQQWVLEGRSTGSPQNPASAMSSSRIVPDPLERA